METVLYNPNDIQLKHPFTSILTGPTGCGKTTFIKKLLENLENVMVPRPQRIIYCFSIWQKTFDELLLNNPSIEFKQGLIDVQEIDKDVLNLVIIDDLMNELKDDATLSEFFTKGSHHRNMSVIFMTQNLFVQGKQMRSVSLNAHYLIVFKNPRDKAQFACLSRHMYPSKQKFLIECFENATQGPYGYIFLDFKQTTKDELRVRTRIFPDEENIVYVIKQ